MKIISRRFLIVLMVGMLATAVACGEDEAENGPDDNDSNTNNSTVELENDFELIDFESDYHLLFSEFAFSPGSPGEDLNPIVANFMDQDENYPIIILLEVSDIDRNAEEAMVRGGAGVHADEPGGGEYRWDIDEGIEEPDSTLGSIDNEGNVEATLPLLNFVATVETEEGVSKSIIPIRDIHLTSQIVVHEQTGEARILDGELAGIITYEDVEDVSISITPGGSGFGLPGILDEDRMNFDYSGDGNDDSWEMSASFVAEETVILESF